MALAAPRLVLLPAVVGPGEVLQHSPCWVADSPPRSVISPPPEAVVVPKFVITAVATVGITAYDGAFRYG